MKDQAAGESGSLFFDRRSLIRIVPVITRGKWLLCCDEHDIRKACNLTRCNNDPEECIRLMTERSLECLLCLVVLRVLGKPFRAIEAWDHGQDNTAHHAYWWTPDGNIH